MKPRKEHLHIEIMFKDDMPEDMEATLWSQLFDLLGIIHKDNPQEPPLDKEVEKGMMPMCQTWNKGV